MPTDSHDNTPAPVYVPLNFKDAVRSLRYAFRAIWDNISIVLAGSILLSLVTLAPIGIVYRLSFASKQLVIAATLSLFIAFTLISGPVYAGIVFFAMNRLRNARPSFAEVLQETSKFYWRAVRLSALQAFGALLLGANLLFYLRARSAIFLIPGIISLYLQLFWWAMSLYQWPIFIASENGTIQRTDGKIPGLKSIIRNSFVMAVSSPVYTAVQLLVLCLIAIPCLLSGAGAAVLLPGVVAFCTSQATLEQLVRFGTIEALPDPDEDVPDIPWKVTQ